VATAAELKRRWDGLDAARLVREVRSWLFGQGPRPDGLDEVDGRVDLRGIPLMATPGTVGNPDDPGAGVTWEALDLSGAQVQELRFFGGRITGCTFDGASLTGLRLWGTTVEDSSFKRADLRSRALGTGDWRGLRNVWRRVAFDRANLRESVFLGCVLEECTFEKTTKLLQITDSEVRDCTFVGQLTSLLVSGQGHQVPVSPQAFSADFSRAVFRDCKIEGYSLDQVKLPEQDDLLVVRHYPSVMKVAASYLEVADTSPAGRSAAALLNHWFKAPGSEESDVCFDLGGFGDAAISDAVRKAVAYAQQA
jgi:uncharacterized protein YjbI with pentapeptide repeats